MITCRDQINNLSANKRNKNRTGDE